MIAGVFTQRRRFVGSAGASRPNKHTVVVTIKRFSSGARRPKAGRPTFFRGPGCVGGCTERAPE
jgi:hypothetical protein